MCRVVQADDSLRNRDVSAQIHPTAEMSDEDWGRCMNPRIMRDLISTYETYKSKGFSGDKLYSLLIDVWKVNVGIGEDGLVPETDVKKQQEHHYSGSTSTEIMKRKETCCGNTESENSGMCCSARIETKKEGGCCGGGRSVAIKKEGGCCAGRSVAIKKEAGCNSEQQTEMKPKRATCCSGGGDGGDDQNGIEKEGGGSCCSNKSRTGKTVRGSCCKPVSAEGNVVRKKGKCCCECGPPRNIFMVDDSLVSCKLTERVLQNCGHRITMCTSGSEAISILTKASSACSADNSEFPFDMFFLDIVMPVTDGIELLGHIKSLPNLVKKPVVMLSGLEDGDLAEKCLEMGAVAVLQKPLKCSAVKRVLSQVVPCEIDHNIDASLVPPCISLSSTTTSYDSLGPTTDRDKQGPPSSLERPSNLVVGSTAPIHSITLRGRRGRTVRAIPDSRVSVILLLPGQCMSESESMKDIVYVVMDVAREQGRVGDAVSLIFVTREEEKVVLPNEIYSHSCASLGTVDMDTWKAFLGVTHTFAAGLLVVDGEGTTVLSWSGLVDHNGNFYEPENCATKDELMGAVHRAARRTLLGTSAVQKCKERSRSLYTYGLATVDGQEQSCSSERSKSSSNLGTCSSCPDQLHILVVDDSAMSCKLSVRKLQSVGFSAEFLTSGKLAIETLRTKPYDFDLVLLGIVMPTVDGMEVLSAIKSDCCLCNIPVFMLSGLVEDEALSRRYVDSGAMIVLSKPLDGKEVKRLVATRRITPNPIRMEMENLIG